MGSKNTKKTERPEKISDRSDVKHNKSAAQASQHKKGRQTNNSLSSVMDVKDVVEEVASVTPRENGSKYRRITQPLNSSSDEAKMSWLGMYKILEQVKNHPDAWPFLDPVDEDFAPDYYTKISQPMDLEKMEQRVSTKYYHAVTEFISDFDLIVDNCKKYNGSESEYSFMVDSLSEEFRLLVSRYLNPIFEPEPFVSGSDSSDCSSDADLSYRKSKSSVPDAKKRGGLMKLAQAFGGHRSAPKASPPPASTNKVKLKTEDVWDTPDSSEAEQKNRKSTSKSKVKGDKKKVKTKKSPAIGGRNLDALNALAAATEQTLKDMNKWLEDTPKFTEEFSSRSSSPSEAVTAKEFEDLSESVEEKNRTPSERGVVNFDLQVSLEES